MSTKTLGDAIAAQRKALHLEQKDVAERLRSYGVTTTRPLNIRDSVL